MKYFTRSPLERMMMQVPRSRSVGRSRPDLTRPRLFPKATPAMAANG